METHTLEALCRGDHKAFETIFIAYYNKVKYFINGLIKSENDAEELTQDIFVKLWINRQSIHPEKSFNTYLYTIARNTAFNFLKHKMVEAAYVKTYPHTQTSDSTDEIIFAQEISLLSEMAVSRMSMQRRKIYQLSRNNGLSNEEIATQLGIAKKTVENQINLALKEIRQIISSFLILFL